MISETSGLTLTDKSRTRQRHWKERALALYALRASTKTKMAPQCRETLEEAGFRLPEFPGKNPTGGFEQAIKVPLPQAE